MSESFFIIILITLFFLTGLSTGIRIGEDRSKPPCTAYEAIDGKPVCIEYQLTK
jgi:hypothetical protein